MKKWWTAATLGWVLSSVLCTQAAAAEVVQPEIETLQSQVAALLARVERLEQALASAGAAPEPPATVQQLEERLAAVEEANDRQTDQLAQGLASSAALDWARSIKWKGDLRYRHEQFDIEGVASDRVRHRIRGRFGLEAKVANTLQVGFQIATGEGRDARSTNSTLDAASQNEEIGLDLAYVDWRPRDGVLVTLGKQRQPWFKAGNSLFFDGDVNPEGAAIAYGGKTGPFARAWGYWLEEMGSAADSNVLGAQLGYAFGNGLTLAAGYWDYGAIQDQPILAFSGSPAGNSTFTAGADCTGSGTTRCYTHDYNIAIVDAQWAGTVGAMPLTLFGGYLENLDPSTLNTGYNLGFQLGKASDPGSWEFGVMYEDIERDAQMAAFVDSDFADGLTQGRGYVLQGAWAPAKNTVLKATYFLNERSYDTPAEADYQRLQLDLNYRF